MDLADRIRELSARAPQQLEHITSEEATKNALIMPFISALGYNVFDPSEVTPELSADVGVKKGEKVDYAILKDGKPIMLFECKASSVSLDDVHTSQLYRYFSVTEARVGVLTNGLVYRFFSDLEEKNKMDSKPFLEFNLLAPDDVTISELKKFSKSSFEVDKILANASELKYTREIKRLINRQMSEPSEEFVRFFVSQVYSGRVTQTVREQFTAITKRALQEFISEKISDRLKSALEREEEKIKETAPLEEDVGEEASEIVTTEEELHGFYIVQAILSQVVDPARVAMRDQKAYCSVYLDDSNRKPICRLRFNSPQKYLGLFDEQKNETRESIGELTDIHKFADRLKATVARYDQPHKSIEQQPSESD